MRTRGSSERVIKRIRQQTGNTGKPVEGLQDLIEIRREELQDIGTHLAKVANRRSTLTSIVKAFVIFLGAIVAARQLISGSNTIIVISFTLAGILIAVLTGLEAAFRWEHTSAELRNLLAISRTAARKASSDFVDTLATNPAEKKPEKLRDILHTLDKTIADIQARSAKLGVDTVVIAPVSERDQGSTDPIRAWDVSDDISTLLTPLPYLSPPKDTVICQSCSTPCPAGVAVCSNSGATIST